MTTTLTRSELEKHLGDALDRSLSAPVIVTKQGRPKNVLISYKEYKRLIARDRRAFHVSELSQSALAEIAAAEMEPGHEHLNAELHRA